MDSIELTRYEVAEYPFSRFISYGFSQNFWPTFYFTKSLMMKSSISDVGGSFGLFLGISAATIVGLIEMLLKLLFRSIFRLVVKFRFLMRN